MASASMVARTTAAAAAALMLAGCAPRIAAPQRLPRLLELPDRPPQRPLEPLKCREVSRLPERSTAELLKALREGDENTRIDAIHCINTRGLAGKAGREFLDDLLKAVDDPSLHMRYCGYSALGRLKLEGADRERAREKLRQAAERGGEAEGVAGRVLHCLDYSR